MTVTGLPILMVDLAGSILMILLSLASLDLVRKLKQRTPHNLIWTYLFWVCAALAAFAVSRSAGHILKQILLMTDHAAAWGRIAAYSGAINTFMLTIVAAITLFFERAWNIYQEIINDRQALRTAHQEVLYLNQNLERLVAERTEALARSEKQMAQADRLASIGQLSSGVAHEINNPLGVILGYTQLLLRGEKEDSQRRRDLKTIEKHVRSCKAIVEDLLNFARSSKPKKETVKIHRSIDEILDFVRHHAKSGEVVLERDYDPRVPPLLLDEKKIKQVIMNLVMNARHAVGGGGTIAVATGFDPEKELVSIRVADTGYGIEKKNLSRIFDPFFTTKPTGEGTGLGLSVSYGIIKNHGGDIIVESEPGTGTTFTVVLPAASAGERSQDGRAGTDHPDRG